jgi:membrane protein implicated in regulation of membrane protease activity
VIRRLALLSWLPIAVGAPLAFYADGSWSLLGLGLWLAGLVFQVVVVTLMLGRRHRPAYG